MITPAISVLSAVEGVGIATPVLSRFVVVLLALFLFQKSGSERVGRLFGPVIRPAWMKLPALREEPPHLSVSPNGDHDHSYEPCHDGEQEEDVPAVGEEAPGRRSSTGDAQITEGEHCA